jgi:hypothetical protein
MRNRIDLVEAAVAPVRDRGATTGTMTAQVGPLAPPTDGNWLSATPAKEDIILSP